MENKPQTNTNHGHCGLGMSPGNGFASWDKPVFDGPPDMLDRVAALTKRITFSLFGKDLALRVERDVKHPKDGRVFMQVIYICPCEKTGKPTEWHGRKWYLSPYMTDDEIVKTAYAACELTVKHEIMEGFKVDGVSLFNPHLDFEELIKISHKEVKR